MGNGNSKKSRKSQVFEIIDERDTTNTQAVNQITVTEVEKVLSVVSSENVVSLKTEPPDLIEETTNKTIPDKQESSTEEQLNDNQSENKTTDIENDEDKQNITTEDNINEITPGNIETITDSEVMKESADENVLGQIDCSKSNKLTVNIDKLDNKNTENNDETVQSKDNDKKMSIKVKEKKKSKKVKEPKKEKEYKKKERLSKKEKKSMKKNSKKEEKQTDEFEIKETNVEVNYIPCQEKPETANIEKEKESESTILMPQNEDTVENEGGEEKVVSSELSTNAKLSENTPENSQLQNENATNADNNETTHENDSISKEPNGLSTAENLNLNDDDNNQNYLQEAFDLIDAAKISIPTFNTNRSNSVSNEESCIQQQTTDSIEVHDKMSNISNESVNTETDEGENIITNVETRMATSLNQTENNFKEESQCQIAEHVDATDKTLTLENENDNSVTLEKDDDVSLKIPLNTETEVGEIVDSTNMTSSAANDSDDVKTVTGNDDNDSPNQTLQTSTENIIVEVIDNADISETSPDKCEDQSSKKDKDKKKKKEKEKKQKSTKEKKKSKNGKSNGEEIQDKDVTTDDTPDTVHNLIQKFEDQNSQKKKDRFIIKKKKCRVEETQIQEETENKVTTTKSFSKSDDNKKSKKKKDKKNKYTVVENTIEISSPVKSIFDDVPAEIEVNHEDVVSLSSLSSDEKETPKTTSEGKTIGISITTDTSSENLNLGNTINPNLLGVDPSEGCSRPNSDEYVTLFVNKESNIENEAGNHASNYTEETQSEYINNDNKATEIDTMNHENKTNDDESCVQDIPGSPGSGNNAQDSVTSSFNESARPDVDDDGLKGDTVGVTANNNNEADSSQVNISSGINGDQTSTPESPMADDNVKSSPKKKSKKASKKKESKNKQVFRQSSDISNIETQVSFEQDPKNDSQKERRRSFSEFLRPVFGNIFSKSSSTSPSKKKDNKEVTTPDEEEAIQTEIQNS